MVQELLAYLGAGGLLIGSVVAASYGLFRWLGKKWIEGQFERSLEHFRHEKMRELESLRADLNTKLNRSAILNEREFEILPTNFRLLTEAYGAVASFTSPLQHFADVDRMTVEQLDEHLETLEFTNFEKNSVASASVKSEKYREFVFYRDLRKANEPYNQFNNYLITNSIFLDDELRESFEEIRTLMFNALHEAHFEHQHPSPRPDRWKEREVFRQQAREKVDLLRQKVRERLLQLKSLEVAQDD